MLLVAMCVVTVHLQVAQVYKYSVVLCKPALDQLFITTAGDNAINSSQLG